MAFFDLPLEELETYLPDREEPDDFDTFWETTLDEVNGFELDADFKQVDSVFTLVDVYDLTFNGYGGQPIKGWFILPKNTEQSLPCVVQFIGYGGGRGYASDWMRWAIAGYAHLVMDTRGQGSNWLHGDTPDIAPDGDNPQYPGFMTRGILSPYTYYYRRVFADAVRAVQAAQVYPLVDANEIAVQGGSQGGGISLAVAALMPDTVKVVLVDVPFLCHYRRATHITNSHPYEEISAYLRTHPSHVGTVFDTLSYFDGVNFAPRATARALFSAGLMDEICPPSTVFAAYNHYAGEKDMRIYTYNGHEGGRSHHTQEQLQMMKDVWGRFD